MLQEILSSLKKFRMFLSNSLPFLRQEVWSITWFCRPRIGTVVQYGLRGCTASRKSLLKGLSQISKNWNLDDVENVPQHIVLYLRKDHVYLGYQYSCRENYITAIENRFSNIFQTPSDPISKNISKSMGASILYFSYNKFDYRITHTNSQCVLFTPH